MLRGPSTIVVIEMISSRSEVALEVLETVLTMAFAVFGVALSQILILRLSF